MFFSGCELIDGTVSTYVEQIKKCLLLFISSPVAHVRNLAAKSYVASVGLSSIGQEICHLKTLISRANNFNYLNGYLIALEYLCEKEDDETQKIRHKKIKSLSEVRKNLEIRSKFDSLWNFWRRRSVLIKQNKLCYTVEAQLVKLSHQFKLVLAEDTSSSKDKDFFYTLNDKYSPGFYEFVYELMSLFINYILYNNDYANINNILGAECIDFGINFLKHAPRDNRTLLITSVDFANCNFEKCHRLLLEKLNSFANESIMNIYKLKLIELQNVDILKFKTFASKLDGTSVRTKELSELMILISVILSRRSGSHDVFENLLSDSLKKSITLKNYFSYSEVLRQSISKGLEILLYNFDTLNKNYRTISLLAALILIKDEVSSIREAILNSLLRDVILNYKLSREIISDEMVLFTILLNITPDTSVLNVFSSDFELLEFFEKYFSSMNQNFSTSDVENPFDDDHVNSYDEESKVISIIAFCIKKKIFKDFKLVENIYENISDNMFDIKQELLEKMNIDSNNLHSFLNIKYEEYLAKKLEVLNKVFFVNKQTQ